MRGLNPEVVLLRSYLPSYPGHVLTGVGSTVRYVMPMPPSTIQYPIREPAAWAETMYRLSGMDDV